MATLTLSARGPATPTTVWKRYAEPRLWASWAPQIQGVDADAERLAAGMRGVVHAGVVRRPTLPVRFEVLAVDDERREWSWRAWVGPLRMRLTHGVEVDPAGVRTWLRVSGPAAVVAAYAPLARLALGRLVRV